MQMVLIVEDHPSLLQILREQLKQPDRVIYTASLLSTAMDAVQARHYDLVILDRSLPDGDGWELLDYLFHSHLDTRICLISNRGATLDRVEGLQRGADDFLPKPFSIAEFQLRAQKLLERLKILDHSSKVIGDFVLFPQLHQVEIAHKRIQLRKREFLIFAYLAKYANQKVSREMVTENVWSQASPPDPKTIDVYIRRLRILLGKYHYTLQTVRNYGYVLRTNLSSLSHNPELKTKRRRPTFQTTLSVL
jgi:DNA-binding response OmpR family regulator